MFDAELGYAVEGMVVSYQCYISTVKGGDYLYAAVTYYLPGQVGGMTSAIFTLSERL